MLDILSTLRKGLATVIYVGARQVRQVYMYKYRTGIDWKPNNFEIAANSMYIISTVSAQETQFEDMQ